MSIIILLLFMSQPLMVAGLRNTSFASVPMEVTEANAAQVFQSDHTPISFKNGHCLGANFEYATAVVFDIDNSHSDAPEHWTTFDDIECRLKELGINYVVVASRNHLLPKDGRVPRPKFHVYLPFSAFLFDSSKFVNFCEWCIKTFNADPKVKSKAQKIFGYGNNPNAFVDFWNEGRCIDEVLTDEDLAAVTQRTQIIPVHSTSHSTNPFVWFVESGEWKNHLADLEEKGWFFYPENGAGITYFQTPEGDSDQEKQDGNINGDIQSVYFFSKAPAPFEVGKGYSIPQFFAGVLFKDTGKVGLAKFAERYLPNVPEIVLNPKAPLESADRFIAMDCTFNTIPTLIYYVEVFWKWDGSAYRMLEKGTIGSALLHFLERAKIACKIDTSDGFHYMPFPISISQMNSIEDMLKRRRFQSISESLPCWIGERCDMPSSVTDPSLLIFGKSKILNLVNMEILPHTPHWFNTAALDFDYDPNATCPKWLEFLDSIFGDDEESKQTLMEWMGLCLTPHTKFQKALFLVGIIRSGKGTIGRIIQKMIGLYNTVAPTIAEFARPFALASFIGKTLAVISDARFAKGTSTQLVERTLNITGEDTITMDRKNKSAVTLRLPTKLMFISNEIPNVFDQSGAFASRFIFLKLSKSFLGKEDLELENKLSSELPGILRLAIQHLQILLKRGHFIQPETGRELMERTKTLSSPIREFMERLQPEITQNEIWEEWLQFCLAEGRQNFGRKVDLWNALETAGFKYDFEAAKILERIRVFIQSGRHGNEIPFRVLYDSFGKSRKEGGAERLRNKLDEMVESGRLVARVERRKGNDVCYYSIPSVPITSRSPSDIFPS